MPKAGKPLEQSAAATTLDQLGEVAALLRF